MIIHEHLEQGSEEWLNIRKGRATASEASKVLTPTGMVSKSRLGYMRKLARECVCSDPLEFFGNKHTEWGNEHEPAARDLFNELCKANVKEYGFCTRPDGVIGFSPDGMEIGVVENSTYEPTSRDFGLEIKCPAVDKHIEYLMEGVLPSEHKLQVHWTMAASRIDKWYFMSYFPDLEPFIIKVEADDFTEKVRTEQDNFIIDYSKERQAVLAAILPLEGGAE
ncbi:YqaJ viral recombinase family protein [Akkermansiaceae bacterium]|nr:YqaJ viral recombinase family protein [Akkermansiaceae bacterium]